MGRTTIFIYYCQYFTQLFPYFSQHFPHLKQAPCIPAAAMKNILKTLALILCLLAAHFGYSQANMEDVVYLKNGNILRGTIIEHVPNKSIKLQMMDRSVNNFTYDEIEKMEQEPRPVTKVATLPAGPGFKSSGYLFIAELGFSAGIGTTRIHNNNYVNKDNAIGIRMVHGAYIDEHWTFGLGIGFEKYKESDFIPITLDTRATLVNGKISPFFGLNAGYGIGLDQMSNGLIINPTFGVKAAVSDNSAFMFSVGHKWLRQESTHRNYYGYYSEVTKSYFFRFITVNAGFSF